jgi:hypothetical protein
MFISRSRSALVERLSTVGLVTADDNDSRRIASMLRGTETD